VESVLNILHELHVLITLKQSFALILYLYKYCWSRSIKARSSTFSLAPTLILLSTQLPGGKADETPAPGESA